MKSRVRGFHRPDLFDHGKSLEQLEGEDWGEPTYHTHLVKECHRLRRVPLRDLTAENMRILIGQDIGMEYLLPLALERLRADPYAEGDCYPGDLLVNVLGSDAEFWRRHPELRRQLEAIAEHAIGPSKSLPPGAGKSEVEYIADAYAGFKRRQASVA